MKAKLENKNEVVKSENTAVALNGNITNAMNVKERAAKLDNKEEMANKYLPAMFITHKETDEFPKDVLVIKQGENMRRVEPAFKMVHILSRDFVRHLNSEQKTYDERAYAQVMEKAGSTTNKYNEVREKAEQGLEGWQIGISSVFAIVEKDKAILVQIEAAGAGCEMWIAVAAKSCVEDGTIARFKDNNMSIYRATSKTTGNSYIASWKLAKSEGRNWFSEEMTPEEGDLISQAYQEQKDQVDLYLTK